MSIKFDFLLRKFRTSDSVTVEPGSVPDASTSDKGIIQLATGAEVTAGTNTAKAVVPSTLKTELNKKVTVVAGKGLSTNDYNNTEKAKVAAAETETTLGIDTASGDTTKFLNQKKQWVVPAGGSGSVPDASTSDKGIIQLATGAEVTTGTNSAKAVVPSTLKTELDKKVTVVSGKGLSTNDYDNTEKAKVAAALTSVPIATSSAWGGVKTRTQPDFIRVVDGLAPTQLPTGVVYIDDLYSIAVQKVNKVTGKGLSANDYTNTEKAKVAAAETETTLGIDTASGDATKFLNQKKQWVVPAGGSGSGPTVELLSTMPTPDSGDVGRVALFTGASTGAYIQNKLYRAVLEGESYVWRPLLPPEQEFSTSPVDIQPGGKYRNTANAAFTLNIGGYAGCRDDAEVVFDAGTGASITAGTGLTLVDAITAGKRNFCVIKFFGTTANLFVVHTEDL